MTALTALKCAELARHVLKGEEHYSAEEVARLAAEILYRCDLWLQERPHLNRVKGEEG